MKTWKIRGYTNSDFQIHQLRCKYSSAQHSILTTMWSDSRYIAVGDVVILWMTREDIQPIVVTPGKELNGRYGVYRHSDLDSSMH
ncbi:hypothetical protein RSOLAG1IB_00652 [Rhizoctonia solani AG-1 IB]|uniref:Uncharacterized protein n=1 Tax=Thanatephorus cucumeris (strain AG1-IB / isolate 7/3/14) TaxID=1108050 RepID=A0A0B7F3M8_THACB|nr:hypothetical protein RSOLAG1IB_00652 [Rhizoctonia solani AG-1 IB]